MHDVPSIQAALTVFSGFRQVAAGSNDEILAYFRNNPLSGFANPPFVFDDLTGERIDLDLRNSEVLPLPVDEPAVRTVGRPRLGVVAREVTLLPRHWDWLGRQPGGASVALRRLVDEARRIHAGGDAVRASREATYRFMSAIAGDLAGFEDAARALFAGNRARFESLVASWPVDVRLHLEKLSAAAWSDA